LTTVIPVYVCRSDSRLRDALVDENGIRTAFTSYIGIAGGSNFDGVFGKILGTKLAAITDGTSNTLMVGERVPPGALQAGGWYSLTYDSRWPDALSKGPDPIMPIIYPGPVIHPGGCLGPFSFGPGRLDNPCDRYRYWSLHPMGACFLFADGSARLIAHSAADVLPALSTCAGGETAIVPD
jgi:hypothetical protein